MDDVILMVMWALLFIGLVSSVLMGLHVTKKARGK